MYLQNGFLVLLRLTCTSFQAEWKFSDCSPVSEGKGTTHETPLVKWRTRNIQEWKINENLTRFPGYWISWSRLCQGLYPICPRSSGLSLGGMYRWTPLYSAFCFAKKWLAFLSLHVPNSLHELALTRQA